MLVITPTSGSATRASSRICPAPRMAISTTATSVSGSISSSVSGTPISLLRLALVATVRATGRSSAARMSLVEVLPALPVMPTTLTPERRRTAVGQVLQRAQAVVDDDARRGRRQRRRGLGAHDDRRRAARERGAAYVVAVEAARPGGRRTGRPAARLRLSVQTRRDLDAAGRPTSRRPPQAAATSPRVSGSTASPVPAQAGELFLGDRAVVEGDLAVADELALLVTLAGDDDGVAGPAPRAARCGWPRGGRAR